MTEAESNAAIGGNHPYKMNAVESYPYLIADGKTMVKYGVPYFDLTQMFSNTTEVLYRDGCCHLNQLGYDYVVEEIAKTVQDNLEPNLTP